MSILDPEDKSSIRLSVQGELVVVEFARDIGWLALSLAEAKELVRMLRVKITELELR